MFTDNSDIKKHIEEMKAKAEQEVEEDDEKAKKPDIKEIRKNKKKEEKANMKKTIVEFLSYKGLTYNEWLETQHRKLIDEMIEENVLILNEAKMKGEK